MLLSLSVCILYIVDILIICIAVYLTTPELRGALKSNYHLLARKYTICARLVGYGSSVQRQSWRELLMQLHLAKSSAAAGTSKMVHSHVTCFSCSGWSGWCGLSLSLSLFRSTMTLQTLHMVDGSQEDKSRSFHHRPRSLTTLLQPHSVDQGDGSWAHQGCDGRGNRPHHLMEEVVGHSGMRGAGSHLWRQSSVVHRKAT